MPVTNAKAGISALSQLSIDAAKDWGGQRIDNLGAPNTDDDAPRARAADILSGRLLLARMPDGTLAYFLRAGGVGVDPAYALLVAGDIPALDTAKITTGRFIAARLLDGTAGYFLKAAGAGVDPAYALLAAADIPALDTAKITTGRFVAARLLDGTSGYFLKAGGAGIDPAYALLVAADIPNLDTSKLTTGRLTAARLLDGTLGHVLTAQGAGVNPVYAAAATPKVSSGEYTGDDTANRAIAHGLGVIPKGVMIFYRGSAYQYFLTNTAAATTNILWLNNAGLSGTIGATVMDGTNFYVGNATNYDYSANYQGMVHRWVAFA